MDISLSLLPIYNFVDDRVDYKFPINIGIIGTIIPQRDYFHLIEISKLLRHSFNDPPIRFFIMGAHPPPIYNYYIDNLQKAIKLAQVEEYISISINVTSNKLLESLKVLHYIAPLANDTKYLYGTLSGSIPIAISHNIPLLINQPLSLVYGLDGQIIYQKKLIEIIATLIKFTPAKYRLLKTNLQNVYSNYNNKNIEALKKIW